MNGWDSEFYDAKSDVQYNLGLKTLALLDIQDGENVLDIGCGTGRLTMELAKKSPSGSITGLDSNPDMIIKANENLKTSKLSNIQFVQENILNYKPKLHFDAIFSNSCFHWIHQTRKLYQTIYNILAPNGRLAAQMGTRGTLDHFHPYFIAPIAPLKLEKHFKNWKYPVKLVGANLLRKIVTPIGFSEIKIWTDNEKLNFDSPEVLLNYLKTAALVPILSQIPHQKQELYLNTLLKIFKSEKDLNLTITMKRLFVMLRKGDS